MEVKRLGIVGTGLIGASVGLAAKRAGVEHVAGYDFSEESLSAARERGAIDEPGGAIADLAESDLIVVAVPVTALHTVVRDLLDRDGQATVTDVGSTKSNVSGALGDPRFVGGHPVTGSEAQGPAHATADLFDGATMQRLVASYRTLLEGIVAAPERRVSEYALLGAAERERIVLCERGIKTFERTTRYTLDLGSVAVLKHETHLPVIVDPSHAAGRRDLVLPLARAAAAVGADGIIVESHPSPEEALCDGPQQIPTSEFGEFAREVRSVVELLGKRIG